MSFPTGRLLQGHDAGRGLDPVCKAVFPCCGRKWAQAKTVPSNPEVIWAVLNFSGLERMGKESCKSIAFGKKEGRSALQACVRPWSPSPGQEGLPLPQANSFSSFRYYIASIPGERWALNPWKGPEFRLSRAFKDFRVGQFCREGQPNYSSFLFVGTIILAEAANKNQELFGKNNQVMQKG